MLLSNLRLATHVLTVTVPLLLASTAWAGIDTDSDGVDDTSDNCILVPNPGQVDADLDGYGNFCDGDFNQDGIVNLSDLALMRLGFFGNDPVLDMNSSGVVNFIDLQLLKVGFLLPPGPAANIAPTALALDNNSVDENQPAGTAVGTFTTTDINLFDTHTYSLVAGAGDTDNAQFAIVGDGLETAAVLNHEATDNCLTSANTCSIRVQTDDGNGGQFQQTLIINIGDVNEAPVITSDGGGATAAVNAAENQTAVTTVTTTDEDLPPQTLTFAISGGADAALFSIGGASGILTFISAPDFENPLDAGPDNVYDVQVTVTDNGAPNLSDVQDIAITVTDANEAPVITSDGGGATAALSVVENTTAVTTVTATDVDLPPQTLTFAISGGADAALFSIGGASGVLTFISPPDFDNPLDAGGNNVYDVQVTVTDDGAPNLSDVQDIAVTVTDVNESPVITSDGGGATAAVDAAENQTAVTTVTATDPDVPAQTLTFAISGGADAALFSIGGASGVLTFISAPDFENPLDAGPDNVYDVQVTVTDDGAPNLSDVQDIAVTVTDVNDAPVITSDGGGATAALSVAENTTAVTTVTATDEDLPAQILTFSITGGADAALFSISGATGVLTFSSAPDFETPLDADGDNVYDVQVTVTDNGVPNLSDVQDIAVTVTDVNENTAPSITSDGGGATAAVSAAENQTAVTTVTATDPEVPPQVLTYSITGGADAALFSIGGASGVLTFNVAPDFENPVDAGGDNVYDVQVTVTDNGAPTASDVQDIAVTVTDANDAPTDIALDNSSVDENSAAGTAVGNFSTTDQDTGDSHTYTLVAGAGDTDNPQFAIVGNQLQTAAVLNFEAADNCVTSASTCSIRVQTDDGNSGTFQESFIININNVNDAPVAAQDDYTGAIGNTRFELVTALSGTTPVPPTVELVGDIDTNDTDEDTADTLAVTANPSIPTAQGGTAAVDANGQFVYFPPAGFPGSGINADSFTYEVCDNGAPVLCDNGTVTIEGSGIVWYVDDSSPNNPGTGTSDDAFRDLSSASGAPTAAGETIFVFAGTQTTNISLLNSQSLIGEGVGLVVGPTTLVDAGVRPLITSTGTAITLAMSNTIRGIDITGSNTGISGSGFATLTGDSIAISTSGGPALDLTSGAGSITFDSVSSSGSSADGIDLDSVSGTFTLGGGTISGSTGVGFRVTGSTATIEYDGTVSTGSPRPVDVSSQSAGSVTFDGLISTTTGEGIRVASNAGGTINFRGGMDLTTTAGNNGFAATGGGTVNVCSDTNCEVAGGTSVNNMVSTFGGSGVQVDNTTIGSGGVTFNDVDVDGGTGAIDINTAGTGGFTVLNGLIQNTTVFGIRILNTDNITISNVDLVDAADDGGAGCSTVSFGGCRAVIRLDTVTTVDITDVTILRSDEHGIFGTNVTDLDMANVQVNNAGQTNEEHGIFIRNLLGTANAGTDSRFDNVDITNSGSNGIFVENTTGTTNLEAQPDLLTVTGTSSVVSHATNSGILVESDAAAANLKLRVLPGYTSTNNTSRGITANANTGRLQLYVTGATFGGGGHFQAIAGGSAAASSGNSELILNLIGNNITQSGSAGTGPAGIAFSSFSGSGGAEGLMRGVIQGNFITSNEPTLSGISLANQSNDPNTRFLIDNNNIQLLGGTSGGMFGMDIRKPAGSSGGTDLVITNNTVNIPNNADLNSGGIFLFNGFGGGTGATICVDMNSNNVATPAKNAAAPPFEFEYGAAVFPTNTIQVQGMSAPFTDANLETYWETVNTTGGTSTGVTLVVTALGGTMTSGTCSAAPLPLP